MSIESAGWGALTVVVIMALVTLVTRWGGVYMMSLVPLGPRMRRFIRAMSGSVLVALLAPMAVGGDSGARLALLTTAVIMLVLKRPLLAIAGGIVAAAVWRLGVG